MTDAEELFFREGTRHRFTARRVSVVEVSRPEDRFVRVTLGGELEDFASTGPSDHAKVFFPHPETGELTAPRPAAGEGIIRPDGPVFARDFTPRGLRMRDGRPVFDLDILRHADPGPAAAWAERASVGDELVVAGPRGSRGATQNAPRVIVVADGSALPAASRWLAEVPESTEMEVVADTDDADLAWVERYLAEASGREVSLTPAGGDPAGTARMLGVDDETYVFAAGEASRLIGLRRYLRRDLRLPAVQVAIQGYWKRGQAAFDHHAPIDPDDPDD